MLTIFNKEQSSQIELHKNNPLYEALDNDIDFDRETASVIKKY